MLKAFLRDSTVYGIARALVLGVNLIALPIYTRELDPSEYGLLEYLLVVVQIAYVTVALEIAQGLSRYFAGAKSADEQRAYGASAFWFGAACYTAFTALILIAARPVAAAMLGDAERAAIVQAAAAALWSTGLFYLAQNILRFQLRPGLYALWSVVFAVVSVGTAVTLLKVRGAGVEGVFLGQFAGGLAGLAGAAWAARHVILSRVEMHRVREMLAFSVPLVPSGLGVMLTLYLDRLMIASLLTFDSLGIYGVGFRIASVVTLAVAGVQMAITPLVYQYYDRPGTAAEIARLFRWFLAGALSLVGGLALFSPELVALAGGREYAGAQPVVFLLALGSLLASLNMFAPGLWIAKRTTLVAAINLGAAALALALNVLLIPAAGIRGAATAGILSAGTAFFLYLRLGHRHYAVPFDWGRCALAFAMVCAAYALSGWGAASLVVRIGVMALLIPGLLVVLLGRHDLESGLRAAGRAARTRSAAV